MSDSDHPISTIFFILILVSWFTGSGFLFNEYYEIEIDGLSWDITIGKEVVVALEENITFNVIEEQNYTGTDLIIIEPQPTTGCYEIINATMVNKCG